MGLDRAKFLRQWAALRYSYKNELYVFVYVSYKKDAGLQKNVGCVHLLISLYLGRLNNLNRYAKIILEPLDFPNCTFLNNIVEVSALWIFQEKLQMRSFLTYK